MDPRRAESGFSLIELLVAIVVTLIITGSVYGLMAGGQNAFRREPELSDRQQNIRSAMAMLTRDVQYAGIEMGPFFQTFSRNLNAVGPAGLGGNSDFIQMFGNEASCPEQRVSGSAFPNLTTVGDPTLPTCYPDPGPMLVFFPGGGAKWGWGHGAATSRASLRFPAAQQPSNPVTQIAVAADLQNWIVANGDTVTPTKLGVLQLVRYEIYVDPADNNTPSLYRSNTGGWGGASGSVPVYAAAPAAAGHWEVVARGIEDMQVQYQNGAGTWSDDPGAVACVAPCTAPTAADYNTIIRQVKITLSSRSTAQNIQGMTTGGALPTAMRGQLTTVLTPRASTQALQTWPDPGNHGATPPPAATYFPMWR